MNVFLRFNSHYRHTVFKVSAPRHLVHLIDDSVRYNVMQQDMYRRRQLEASVWWVFSDTKLVWSIDQRLGGGLYSCLCHHFTKLSPAYRDNIINTIVMINQVNFRIMMIYFLRKVVNNMMFTIYVMALIVFKTIILRTIIIFKTLIIFVLLLIACVCV